MKVEFSDAPERITRRGRRTGVQGLVACLAIGSVVGVSALLWAARSEPYRGIASMESKAQALDADVVSDTVIRSMPASLDTDVYPAPRQTSFNDQNFISTGAHNIVTFHQSPDKPPRTRAPQKVKLTIVGQTPSMKDGACWPFRQGSVESRNCRLSVGLKHRD